MWWKYVFCGIIIYCELRGKDACGVYIFVYVMIIYEYKGDLVIVVFRNEIIILGLVLDEGKNI